MAYAAHFTTDTHIYELTTKIASVSQRAARLCRSNCAETLLAGRLTDRYSRMCNLSYSQRPLVLGSSHRRDAHADNLHPQLRDVCTEQRFAWLPERRAGVVLLRVDREHRLYGGHNTVR